MSLEGVAAAENLLRGKINSLDTLTISAYAIAVKNGFEGTEEEWVASLAGNPGLPGKSAYEYAQEGGYGGTEEEFAALLASGIVGYVNPVKFGAKGDGVTDDSAAFMAAINSVEHGTIYIPNGTYLLKYPLFLEGRKNLRIMGDSKSIIYTENNTFMEISGCAHVEISNLFIHGNSENVCFDFVERDKTDPVLSRSSEVKLHDITSYDFAKHINIDSSTGYFYFEKYNVHGNYKVGICIGENFENENGIPANYIYMNRCNIEGRNNQTEEPIGIAMYNTFYSQVLNCDICNISGIGMYVTRKTYGRNIRICNNEFFNNAKGLVIEQTTDYKVSEITVSNNLFYSPSAVLGLSLKNTLNCLVSENMFSGMFETFVELVSFTNGVFANNVSDYVGSVPLYEKCNITSFIGRNQLNYPYQKFTVAPGETITVVLDCSKCFYRSQFHRIDTLGVNQSKLNVTYALDGPKITLTITNTGTGGSVTGIASMV